LSPPAQVQRIRSDGPLLCLCLTAPTIAEDVSILREYGGYADVVELRVDCLREEECAHARRIPSLAGLPAVLTVRRIADGGMYAGSEAERVGLLKGLVGAGFAYLDVEEDLVAASLEHAALSAGVRVIRSLHDPKGVPADLEPRLRRLARNAQELPKAAVAPRSSAELARLLSVAAGTRGTEKILLGMGEMGFCTRVLAGKIGSRLCYASAPGREAAPGHTDPRTLVDLYRFKSIGAETAVFGVIGNPISHSLSPMIQNKGFAGLGIDAVYLPFLVDDPAAFMAAADLLGVRGLSVTIPHKQAVIPLLARRDPLVEAAGACNTLTRARETGGWAGTNTDIEGFLSPLRAAFDGTIPSSLAATVLGAGGAARGVVSALSSLGARILVLNRDVERAQALASVFDARWSSLDEAGARLMPDFRDLVVQTTSVGMEPAAGSDPLPEYRFSGREAVYDLVYRPAETRFLRRAREAGCRTISGERMLLAQAFLQFKLFTGSEYPRQVAEELGRRAENGGLPRL
jgi:3-dehydroquinate dehydratase/shikimate dehydrogenase